KDGYLSVSGWKENSNKLTMDYLKEVNDYGVSRLIYTDINRDGTKQSPNLEETIKVADISNCPVIISFVLPSSQEQVAIIPVTSIFEQEFGLWLGSLNSEAKY
ncbi:MAG: hypothetical protein HN879_02310, partial [Flavobacteriaceae bacterium]|nr:hypothetical protein [Flavobacteriaceae bacterium]